MADQQENIQECIWSLLIYVAGDNNLSEAGVQDIQEMCSEGASSDVHVGVEIDTFGHKTGSTRYEIGIKNTILDLAEREVVCRLEETDCGDPETLKQFLSWGFERVSAKNRAVVIWGHGAGFPSVARDDATGTTLDMPEIEGVLKAVLKKGDKVRLLGFDACLMSMLEVVHHLKDQVEIVVGSQQTEPADGWPYHRVLKMAKMARSPENLAQSIVNEYIEDHRQQVITNITQSAVRTAGTEAVVKAVQELGGLLSANLKSVGETLLKARNRVQSFIMAADYVDLVHFCRLMLQFSSRIDNKNGLREQVNDAIQQIMKSMTNCLILNKNDGPEVSNAHGLSIWFPLTKKIFESRRHKYEQLHFNDLSKNWINFLEAWTQFLVDRYS